MSHHPDVPPPLVGERHPRLAPSRARPGRLSAGAGSHSLQTFADCLELALHLAHDFDHAHVAALTDGAGEVLDGTILSDAAHTIDHAAGFALCLALACAAPDHQLTFFSVRAHAASPLRPADRACWRRLRDVFDHVVDVRDWIVTDGIAIRSMAVSTGDTTAWVSPGHDAPPNTSTPPNRHAGDA